MHDKGPLTVCQCKGCKAERENEAKHMNNPFYKKVRDFWNQTRRDQIIKGSEKYPEPFNPDSWTNDELASHAMQENYDQAVYITGCRDRMRKQENRILQLELALKEIAKMDNLALNHNYIVERYAQYARDVLENGK